MPPATYMRASGRASALAATASADRSRREVAEGREPHHGAAPLRRRRRRATPPAPTWRGSSTARPSPPASGVGTRTARARRSPGTPSARSAPPAPSPSARARCSTLLRRDRDLVDAHADRVVDRVRRPPAGSAAAAPGRPPWRRTGRSGPGPRRGTCRRRAHLERRRALVLEQRRVLVDDVRGSPRYAISSIIASPRPM